MALVNVREMMKKAEEKGVKFLTPVDTVITKEFKNDTEYKTVPTGEIPDEWGGLDIGEETRKLFADAIKGAKTVVWNGPMGVFEFAPFAKGTLAVCEMLANLEGATTIIGGGDVTGSVVLMMNTDGSMPTQTEIKLVSVAASFLGKQTEE